jgi:sterol desaturase/sphingolipid hydroxylase (fatty acid hydroxylase superfamily)
MFRWAGDALEIIASAVPGAALAFVLLAALFVPLERVFPARLQSLLRPAICTDLAYFALQNLAMVFVLLAFNDALGDVALDVVPLAVPGFVRTLPWAVQVVVAVVAGDVLLYWGHRACHAVPVLWRFHAVHHSARHLDWVAAHREHPLDGLFSQLCLNLPAALLGIPIAVVGPLFLLRGLSATFVHSNVRLPLGRWGLLLGDPVLHRWHHADVPRCVHNFANVAPYLDVLFGTHHRPADEHYSLGIDEPMPDGVLAQLVHPFRRRTPREHTG